MPVIDTHTDLPWAPTPNRLTVHLNDPAPEGVPVTAVVVLVRDGGGNVLLTHVDSRGWDLPGGHVEGGETTREAAARELLEETGLVLTDPEALIQLGHQELHVTGPEPDGYAYPYPRTAILVYGLDLTRDRPSVQPLPDIECSSADWFTPAEAQAHLSSKTWRHVLAALDRPAL